ncbi:MAG: hypothetical protein F6K65_33120, partial [Moorea sp. SIO3C2]|nr:hypothetical protein [Moorena sp. SIO3C2]
ISLNGYPCPDDTTIWFLDIESKDWWAIAHVSAFLGMLSAIDEEAIAKLAIADMEQLVQNAGFKKELA